MKYALYAGCTVLGRGRNYEMAVREVSRVLNIELIDYQEFECCGFPLKSVHHETFVLMAARNLLAAEMQDLDVCALCSACTSSLTEVNKYLQENFHEKARIVSRFRKAGIDYRLHRNIVVKHFTKILYEDIGIEEIKKRIKKPLNNIRVAAHYGCHYLKPTQIYKNPEDPENPQSLDELIRTTGADSLNHAEKLKCCGAGLLALNEDLAYAVAQPKLEELAKNSIDAMVLMCPFCSVMFDDNQRKMEQKFQKQYNLPILYYPQLLGLALGIDEKALGFRMNRVSTKKLLEKISKL